MKTNNTTSSPAKLRDGSWGARVAGFVAVGDTIEIVTRSGKQWYAVITRVVWSKDGVSLCATRSADRAPARRVERPTFDGVGTYCGQRCPVRGVKCCAANGPCHDCI
jgi:hypothetical protein